MEKASSFFKSSLYSAGYVSKADADAQTKCFEYLVEALAFLQKEIDTAASSNAHQTNPMGMPPTNAVGMLKNQQVILQSSHDILNSFKGSFVLKKAQRFWESWDGCKRVAYEIYEGRDKSKQDFEKKMGQLEEGRYLK